MRFRVFLSLVFSFYLVLSIISAQDIGDERNISPTISIRYDDILSGMSPSSTIGILLNIDEDKYTGFDTTADGNELRLLVGWRWTVLGLGTKDVNGAGDIVGMYSFGAKYRVLDNMFTSMEYVMVDHDTVSDYIRMTIGVDF